MIATVLSAVILALCVATAIAQLPSPSVPFQSNPYYSIATELIPTADPLVVSSQIAFVCYALVTAPSSWCQMISPSDSSYAAPISWLNDSYAYSTFDIQPQLLTLESAVYSTNSPYGSFWGASGDLGALNAMDRMNSTAQCSADPTTNMAFIPYGVHAGLDMLASYNLLNITSMHMQYLLTWNHSTVDNQLSLVHDTIAYNGQLLFMHNNTFYSYNGSNGHLFFGVNDPCHVGGVRDGMNLARGTYGADMNGDLDAFIVYGNTTAHAAGGGQFTVCRVSHNSGQLEWNFTLAEDFIVHDVSGGGGLLFMSGVAVGGPNPNNFVTLIIDAISGVSYGFIPRSFQDFRSFPAIIPASFMAPECGPAIVLQQHINTTAYCINGFYINKTVDAPLWVSPFECNSRPLFDPTTGQLVCVSINSYVVSLMALNGQPVWLDETRYGMTQPQLVIENGISYAFILDIDATLHGFQIPLVAPTLPPLTPNPTPPATPSPQGSNPSGIGSGAAVGIAFAVIGAAAAIGIAAYTYVQRSKRRSYASVQNINDREYGGV